MKSKNQTTKTPKTLKKLVLNKRTIRELTPSELAENAGGRPFGHETRDSACLCNC